MLQTSTTNSLPIQTRKKQQQKQHPKQVVRTSIRRRGKLASGGGVDRKQIIETLSFSKAELCDLTSIDSDSIEKSSCNTKTTNSDSNNNNSDDNKLDCCNDNDDAVVTAARGIFDRIKNGKTRNQTNSNKVKFSRINNRGTNAPIHERVEAICSHKSNNSEENSSKNSGNGDDEDGDDCTTTPGMGILGRMKNGISKATTTNKTAKSFNIAREKHNATSGRERTKSSNKQSNNHDNEKCNNSMTSEDRIDAAIRAKQDRCDDDDKNDKNIKKSGSDDSANNNLKGSSDRPKKDVSVKLPVTNRTKSNLSNRGRTGTACRRQSNNSDQTASYKTSISAGCSDDDRVVNSTAGTVIPGGAKHGISQKDRATNKKVLKQGVSDRVNKDIPKRPKTNTVNNVRTNREANSTTGRHERIELSRTSNRTKQKNHHDRLKSKSQNFNNGTAVAKRSFERVKHDVSKHATNKDKVNPKQETDLGRGRTENTGKSNITSQTNNDNGDDNSNRFSSDDDKKDTIIKPTNKVSKGSSEKREIDAEHDTTKNGSRQNGVKQVNYDGNDKSIAMNILEKIKNVRSKNASNKGNNSSNTRETESKKEIADRLSKRFSLKQPNHDKKDTNSNSRPENRINASQGIFEPIKHDKPKLPASKSDTALNILTSETESRHREGSKYQIAAKRPGPSNDCSVGSLGLGEGDRHSTRKNRTVSEGKFIKNERQKMSTNKTKSTLGIRQSASNQDKLESKRPTLTPEKSGTSENKTGIIGRTEGDRSTIRPSAPVSEGKSEASDNTTNCPQQQETRAKRDFKPGSDSRRSRSLERAANTEPRSQSLGSSRSSRKQLVRPNESPRNQEVQDRRNPTNQLVIERSRSPIARGRTRQSFICNGGRFGGLWPPNKRRSHSFESHRRSRSLESHRDRPDQARPTIKGPRRGRRPTESGGSHSTNQGLQSNAPSPIGKAPSDSSLCESGDIDKLHHSYPTIDPTEEQIILKAAALFSSTAPTTKEQGQLPPSTTESQPSPSTGKTSTSKLAQQEGQVGLTSRRPSQSASKVQRSKSPGRVVRRRQREQQQRVNVESTNWSGSNSNDSKSSRNKTSKTSHSAAKQSNERTKPGRKTMYETDADTVVAGNRTNEDRTKIYSEGKVEIGKDGKKRLVFEICEVPIPLDASEDVTVVSSPCKVRDVSSGRLRADSVSQNIKKYMSPVKHEVTPTSLPFKVSKESLRSNRLNAVTPNGNKDSKPSKDDASVTFSLCNVKNESSGRKSANTMSSKSNKDMLLSNDDIMVASGRIHADSISPNSKKDVLPSKDDMTVMSTPCLTKKSVYFASPEKERSDITVMSTPCEVTNQSLGRNRVDFVSPNSKKDLLPSIPVRRRSTLSVSSEPVRTQQEVLKAKKTRHMRYN